MSPADPILEFDPPRSDPGYTVTVGRAPLQPELRLPPGWFHHIEGPVFGQMKIAPIDADLTAHGSADPVGQRVIVFGRVSDSDGRPVRRALVEIWQANAAGGYIDSLDLCGFALDPNFKGAGRCLTGDDGSYRFTTVRPGPYPAQYSPDFLGWRAAHIHFSVLGNGICSRLVTQMYFEGDPLLRQDRMVLAIPDPRGRDRLVARFSPEDSITESFGPRRTQPTIDGSGRLVHPPAHTGPRPLPARNLSAQAYRFDIVLRGDRATPFEAHP